MSNADVLFLIRSMRFVRDAVLVEQVALVSLDKAEEALQEQARSEALQNGLALGDTRATRRLLSQDLIAAREVYAQALKMLESQTAVLVEAVCNLTDEDLLILEGRASEVRDDL